MNPQPVSLADELRKAVDRAFLKISKCDPYYRKIYEEQIAMVNRELSALLAQHAVAEPQRVLTEHQRKVEEAAGMPIDWGMANASTVAHAAEQPKLTEGQARAITTAVLKVLSAGWRDIDDGFTEEGKRKFIKAVQEAALLTSPVAPPPPQADPWFKPYANCDWCGQATHDERLFGKSCSNGGGFMREACSGTYRLNPIFEKPTAAPPVAPGEQPPRPSDREEGKGK